jgi:hypothetical protein
MNFATISAPLWPSPPPLRGRERALPYVHALSNREAA